MHAEKLPRYQGMSRLACQQGHGHFYHPRPVPAHAAFSALVCHAVGGVCGMVRPVMAVLPLSDCLGNLLVSFDPAAGTEPESPDDAVPMPLSLVVAVYAGRVLMVLDAARGQWELRGGMRERAETPRQAAVRELAEETGIVAVNLEPAAVAGFCWRVRPAGNTRPCTGWCCVLCRSWWRMMKCWIFGGGTRGRRCLGI